MAKRKPINPKAATKSPGRPKLGIDPAEVQKLALFGANNSDIADFYGCDEGVIRKRFAEQLKMGRAERRSKLRKWQWDSAESGNVTMQIWLGKNELGQKDKAETSHDGTVKVVVEYVDAPIVVPETT